MRRATVSAVVVVAAGHISIHALREEGDCSPSFWTSFLTDFYPRPPRGGRRSNVDPESTDRKFLSTPSARRATSIPSAGCSPQIYFYPRPPRGGRPARERLGRTGQNISIHALREEGDPSLDTMRWRNRHFYPRPPRGGRQPRPRHTPARPYISIHALREEGDPAFISRPFTSRISIHALREEGDHPVDDLHIVGYIFLSTPSARRATWKLIVEATKGKNFYPRPPRGGRRYTNTRCGRNTIFLSTPSARRATTGSV